MPTDFARARGVAAIKRALDFLIDDSPDAIEPSTKSDAPVAAYNITVLAHLVATKWVPDLSDHVVMLEDVGEYLYRIDRAMFAIVNAQAMQNVRGIMLGRISDIPENDRLFGSSEEEIIRHWCAAAKFDYLGRADIGHDSDNKIVPFGRAGTSIKHTS